MPRHSHWKGPVGGAGHLAGKRWNRPVKSSVPAKAFKPPEVYEPSKALTIEKLAPQEVAENVKKVENEFKGLSIHSKDYVKSLTEITGRLKQLLEPIARANAQLIEERHSFLEGLHERQVSERNKLFRDLGVGIDWQTEKAIGKFGRVKYNELFDRYRQLSGFVDSLEKERNFIWFLYDCLHPK